MITVDISGPARPEPSTQHVSVHNPKTVSFWTVRASGPRVAASNLELSKPSSPSQDRQRVADTGRVQIAVDTRLRLLGYPTASVSGVEKTHDKARA